MLPDIRLDFISKIDQQYIDIMTELRKEFILLDDKIRVLGLLTAAQREGAERCLSLSRTNIEIACQYSIKALCLMGEVIEK